MTSIFKSYSDFLDREDNKLNGVSEEFAANHPNFIEQNETNEGCWDCSRCSGCSDCSRCSDCSDCSRCSRCSRCSDCSDCSGCSRCSGCSGCSRCSDCSYCSRCSRSSYLKNSAPQVVKNNILSNIPVIENIHQRVYDAASKPPEALNMETWHSCDTTHCRAGWVVHLAGKPGYELEKMTSTPHAAKMIYAKSSPIRVSPVRFYEDNEKALKDMKRCAEEEAKG